MLKNYIEKIIYDMPNFYRSELHKKCRNLDHKNSLIISFSFIKEAFSLYKYIDNFDVLYFSCESNVYYLSNVEAINSFMDMIIKEHNYTKVILVGASKGGFASCLYGILLSNKLPNINFNSLVFSAQTLLYPKNDFVLDNSKIFQAYKHSFTLVKGHWWRNFIIIFATYLISMIIIGLIIAIITTILFFAGTVKASPFVAYVLLTLYVPLPMTAILLVQYNDLKLRHQL